MKRLNILLIATALLVPAFAQGATKVKVGFINSITGPEAPIGENLSNGVTLALEDLNKKDEARRIYARLIGMPPAQGTSIASMQAQAQKRVAVLDGKGPQEPPQPQLPPPQPRH